MCFVIYQEQKKWWENVIFTIRVLSRLTAVLTWAASLGWTSAVTCCNMYREYHVPVVFGFFTSYVHRFCSPHHSNSLSFEMQPDWILVLCGWQFLLIFVVFRLTCNSSIMRILPLPPCGLYSIRAQHGYGHDRPCKVVLLTLVTRRRVTDLYLSWGVNIEHVRTAYHKTCGTEYQQPYRGYAIHKHPISIGT